MELDDLIARLERAEGPSAELDEAIASAVLVPDGMERLVAVPGAAVPIQMYRFPDGSRGTALRFSASIDAALTLVPESAEEVRIQIGNQTRHANATVDFDTFHGGKIEVGAAIKPALALCIAALRARKETPNG